MKTSLRSRLSACKDCARLICNSWIRWASRTTSSHIISSIPIINMSSYNKLEMKMNHRSKTAIIIIIQTS
jgi:hypothetical protein